MFFMSIFFFFTTGGDDKCNVATADNEQIKTNYMILNLNVLICSFFFLL